MLIKLINTRNIPNKIMKGQRYFLFIILLQYVWLVIETDADYKSSGKCTSRDDKHVIVCETNRVRDE